MQSITRRNKTIKKIFFLLSYLSLWFLLIPTISFAYLVSEANYFSNEKKFRPSSIRQIKKLPTAFIDTFVTLKTKIIEVSLDKRPVMTLFGPGEHSYLKLKCSEMVDDYEEKIEIFIDPHDFDMNVGEISRKLLPIKDTLILLYGYVREPSIYSFADVQIDIYAVRTPNERIPNIPKKRSAATICKLNKDGPEMLNMVNDNNNIRENEHRLKEIMKLIYKLEEKDRENINIQILEAFTQLKYSRLMRGSYKDNWEKLYHKIINSGNNKATQMLMRILKDNNPWVRLYAAVILGEIGDKRALDDLKRLTLKENEKNWKVRKYAAKSYKLILSRN